MDVLIVRNVSTFYGKRPALSDISLSVAAGEVVGVVGRNGMGKTTLIKSILGLLRARTGEVWFFDQRIDGLSADAIARLGVGYVPQERGVFPEFTVDENLRIRRQALNPEDSLGRKLFERFPILSARRRQRAGTLSGGEAKIVSIARAVLSAPRLLLLDEPTEGLMPVMTMQVIELIRTLAQSGTCVLMAEQNVAAVAGASDRVYVIERGRIGAELTCRGDELRMRLSECLGAF